MGHSGGTQAHATNISVPCMTGRWKTNSQLPIVYHPNYNISFLGLEKLHPFDSCKFQKVVAGLKTNGIIESTEQLVQPSAVSQEDLLKVHTHEYLHALNSSSIKVAKVGRSHLIPFHQCTQCQAHYAAYNDTANAVESAERCTRDCLCAVSPWPTSQIVMVPQKILTAIAMPVTCSERVSMMQP